jgi:DNA-binding MarR family transcriptional regulator
MSNEPDVFGTIGGTVRAMRGRLDRALQDAGLRLGQYQLLRLLWEEDGLTPRELADGFVRREAHPADARSVRIYLTPKGLELRERVSRILASETERALHGFSNSERRTIVSLMERIAANVRHEDDVPRA